MIDDVTAMWPTGGTESNDMTVVGFVLASEFCRERRPSSDVNECGAPMDDNVSRRSGCGGGLEPRTRCGNESALIGSGREAMDIDRVGDGGIGRTLASSSA